LCSAIIESTEHDKNNELQHPQETIKELKRKLKIYQQKCRRYQKKIHSLTLLAKHLQNRQLLSQNAAEFLEVRI